MKQIISALGIAGFLSLLLFPTCSTSEDSLPLQVMHGVIGDTLKVLAKGSPPFNIQVSRNDTTLATQTLDSIGFIAFPMTNFRANPGEYLIAVESAGQDTLFSIQIAEKSAEQLFEEQQQTIAKPHSIHRPSRSSKGGSVPPSKNHSTEWSEWERSACFRMIWFRYKYTYIARSGVYRYNFQVYNEYSPKVILHAALIDQRDKADLDRVKTNGGSLMGKTSEYHLGYRDYDYHNTVRLATDKPYFYIWRMQKSNPVAPYEECDQ
ncbi:MAG: hypothetical protein AAFY76_00220 [Cyanobacteria bacterium J06649_11]